MFHTICLPVFLFVSLPGWSVAPAAEDEELDRGIMLAMDGEYEQALEIFVELLRPKPDDPILNYYAGLVHFYLSQMAEARSSDWPRWAGPSPGCWSDRPSPTNPRPPLARAESPHPAVLDALLESAAWR